MKRNLGATTLRRRQRATPPMHAYDALPKPLRQWLAGAALPWSPASAKRIWEKACKERLSPDDALRRLARAEEKMLSRDKFSCTGL